METKPTKVTDPCVPFPVYLKGQWRYAVGSRLFGFPIDAANHDELKDIVGWLVNELNRAQRCYAEAVAASQNIDSALATPPDAVTLSIGDARHVKDTIEEMYHDLDHRGHYTSAVNMSIGIMKAALSGKGE